MSIDLRPGAAALESPKAVPGAETVASHWLAVSSALTQTQAVQNASIPPEAWTGAAADAASNEIQVLGHKLADLAEVFPDPAQGLKTWKSQVDQAIQVINGLQQQWDDAVATYNKAIAAISSRRMTEDNFHLEIEEKKARATLEGAQRPLKKSYEDQLHQLNEAASQKADSIKAAADSKISPEAVKRGRDAVGAELLGTDMPIAGGVAMWEDAQARAPRMVEDLEELANSKKPLTEEQIKNFQAQWGSDLQNPFFVQAMVDRYRIKHGQDANFFDLVNKLVISVAGDSSNASEYATRNSMIQDLGTAMVLSTGGVNASGQEGIARSESYVLMRDYLFSQDGKTKVSQIERMNIENLEAVGEKEFQRFPPSDTYKLQGYQIFTQATAYAGAKNPDLAFGRAVYEGGNDSLASKLVQFDYNAQGGVRWDTSKTQGPVNLLNFDSVDGTLFTQCTDPLQSLYLLSDTPDSLNYSGLPSQHHELAVAEHGRLGAIRGFLNQDTPFEVKNDWDREGSKSAEKVPMVRYLTGNRNYGFNGYGGFADGGDAFGSMIEDVTRPFGDDDKSILGDRWQNASNEQARIVGNFTAGYQDGLDHDGLQEKTQSHFGLVNSKLRSHAGVILGNWAESLARADGSDSGQVVRIASKTVGTDRLTGGDSQAYFTLAPKLRDALYSKDGLFADLAYDNPRQTGGQNTIDPFDDTFEGGRPPALAVVTAGAYAGYKHDLSMAMAADYHVDPNATTPKPTWSDGVRDSVNRWGRLFEHLEAAASDKSDDVHQAIAQRNRVVRGAIDLVANTVPFSKLPGPKIIESLLSTSVTNGKNSVLDALLPMDFNREELSKRIAHHYAATQAVTDTLVSTYTDRDVWPNPEEKSKQELVSEFLKEEKNQGSPVEAGHDGGLPPYDKLEPDQRERLINFLKARTYLKEPIEQANIATWDAFSRQFIYRH